MKIVNFVDCRLAVIPIVFAVATWAMVGQASAAPILTPGDPILSIDLEGQSETPAGEPASRAIDGIGNVATNKYLNRGGNPEPLGTNYGINTGFIVTPTVGTRVGEFGTIVTSFVITTANDADVRDPASWDLFGTNDLIQSLNESDGNGGENWTLIDSGLLALPAARLTAGTPVAVTGASAYTSYRMVFPTLKGGTPDFRMQIAEIQFDGTVSLIPEPSSLALLGFSGLALLLRRRR